MHGSVILEADKHMYASNNYAEKETYILLLLYTEVLDICILIQSVSHLISIHP